MAHATSTWFALGLLLAQPVAAFAASAPPTPAAQAMRIVAVVNGDVISNSDVDNRTRLFALSTGLPMTPDVLDRLKHQITRQLIDEKLRMQEVQRRHIVIADKAIADAIHDIEARNDLPAGALRQKLSAGGVGQRTLIDQLRTQLGWTQVLREQLGDQVKITDAEVAEQQRVLAQQVGKPEYRVGEIFIPVDDPAAAADAQRFAETVISELRSRRPVPGGRRAVQPEPDGAAGWRAGLGAAESARSRCGAPGRRNAGRRDQQPGEGAGRILDRDLAGQARDRPRGRHRVVAAPGVPAVHQRARSAGADRAAEAGAGEGARHQRQRA